MKYEDVVYLIQVGTALAGMATGNPAVAAFGELGARLLAAAKRAYVSGRSRGEWTAEQERDFDERILPQLLGQPHWRQG